MTFNNHKSGRKYFEYCQSSLNTRYCNWNADIAINLEVFDCKVPGRHF